MSLRAALVGCGKIASEFADDPKVPGIHSHAGAYAASKLTELVAVCDTDPKQLRRCGRRWGIEAQYTSLDEMLAKEDLDLVSVCTPDSTHSSILRTLLDDGGIRGILAEKPLAMTVREGKDIVAKARARHIPVAVNYIRRYAPAIQRLRSLVEAGSIGTIQAVGGFYTKGTFHNGTHLFDLARFLVGNVVRVRGWNAIHDRQVDPTLDAELEFANGASGHLQALRSSEYTLFEMDLLGSAGRIRLTESGHRIQMSHVAPSRHYSGYQTLAPQRTNVAGLRDVLLHAVEDLARAVKTGGTPQCTAADGLAALKIAEGITRSAATGRWVRVA